MGTLVDVILATREVTDRGFTFTDGDSERFWPYAQVVAEAGRIAGALRAMGLGKGDRLGLVLHEPQDFVMSFLGAVLAGVVPVALYPPISLGTLDTYQAGVRRVFDVAGVRHVLTAELLLEVLGPIERPLQTFETLPRQGGGFAPEAVTGDDLAFLQFTSGSTAAPKGVRITHRALLANAGGIADRLDVRTERDHAVSWLPLYHDMGLIGFLIVPMLRQASTCFLSPLAFLKNPTIWPELMHRRRATMGFAPNFAYALLARRATEEQLSRWDLSAWRVAGCGGEPVQPDTLRRFTDRFARCRFAPEAFLPSYGLAEATLAVAMKPLGTKVRTLTTSASQEVVSCGRVLPGHELVIAGEHGPLPDGQEGQILVRGPSLADGYFSDPAATGETFRGGWLRTGDLGFVQDGELYVTGREKDLVIINGRNHHPQSIEWVVNEVEGLRRGCAVAFSRPGAEGEELVVVVEARSAGGAAGLAAQIAKRVRAELSLSVADVVVLPAEGLPKTSSGKLQRRRTRELYLSGSLPRMEG
jgi:fatty-acyl-CoA synthase